MIRTTAVPRPVRIGVATVGIAGALALAGCSTTDASAETDTTTDSTTTESSATPDSGTTTDTATSAYTDGTYTAEGSYATPESVETIEVSVTLADGIITAVDVTGDPQKSESERYQEQFIGGIEEVVVGKSIDEISVDRVAGSSLTSGGFNEAIDVIKSEAAA